MKKAILLIAVLIGFGLFSAPRAQARPFIGISVGGPGYYYGPGFYPYAYDYVPFGYYGGYGRPYYRSYYYGGGYYHGSRGGYYHGYRGGYYNGYRGGSYGRGGYRSYSGHSSSHGGYRR